jgi:hypothetical protein
MNEPEEHTIQVEIPVPAHLVDEDGTLNPAAYETLFEMLGKKLFEDGPTVNSINVISVGVDTP